MTNPIDRIKSLSKLNPKTGCWEWIKSFRGTDPLCQYGHLIVGSRKDKTRQTISAHRYSFEIFNGDIPHGLNVLHSCDNPKCVNPEHLFLGTRQDNVNDREYKGRNKPAKAADKHPRTVLSNAQVILIKNDIIVGMKLTAISQKYNVKTHIIKDISSGRTWQSILPNPPKQ